MMVDAIKIESVIMGKLQILRVTISSEFLLDVICEMGLAFFSSNIFPHRFEKIPVDLFC